MKKPKPIVVLHEDQSAVKMSGSQEAAAIEAAYFVTMSPHEWEWTSKQSAEMAHYVLWAHQRLSAIEQLVTSGRPLMHAEESRLLVLCRELDVEMDGVECPASAAAILNAIRGIVA